jgi:hypothetical protein
MTMFILKDLQGFFKMTLDMLEAPPRVLQDHSGHA